MRISDWSSDVCSSDLLFERLPGKLLLSNVVLCSLFGATSGSSMATAATVGSAAYPELRAKGYNRTALLGSLAGSGTLGILIPPSIPIIIYASLTNVSVGASFVAAVIPAPIAVTLFQNGRASCRERWLQ